MKLQEELTHAMNDLRLAERELGITDNLMLGER